MYDRGMWGIYFFIFASFETLMLSNICEAKVRVFTQWERNKQAGKQTNKQYNNNNNL